MSQLMIRYGELSIKGKNKGSFVNKLAKNVKNSLKRKHPKAEVDWNYSRMYVELNGEESEEVIECLKDIFGIQTISPVIQVEKEMATAEKAVVEIVQPLVSKNKSFKINTRRSDRSFKYDTLDINKKLGLAVETAFPELEVKMDNPDLTIRVEIRDKGIFLSVETIPGLGGLPVGTAGKGILQLSGGIDSPVAGYLSMKRGIQVEAVHFASPPYTSPKALEKTKKLAAKMARFSGEIQFLDVPFTEIQEQIKKNIPDGYAMTVTRRMMLRITDQIRRDRGALTIMTGESLGQVASQTLESMYAINEVTSTPILRPLITMDKDEIVNLAKEIDTFNLSILPYEDSCTVFAPNRPRTKPNLEDVYKFEENLDIEGLINRAISGIKVESISAEDDVSADEAKFDDLL